MSFFMHDPAKCSMSTLFLRYWEIENRLRGQKNEGDKIKSLFPSVFFWILKWSTKVFATTCENDLQVFLRPIQHFEWILLFLQIWNLSWFFHTPSTYVCNSTIHFPCNGLMIPNCKAILTSQGDIHVLANLKLHLLFVCYIFLK